MCFVDAVYLRHEPPPLPALSPAQSRGEGGRRPGEGSRNGSWSQCTVARPRALHEPALSSNRWLGKAALKTHALQTLRDARASPKRAKRLECVRFIGAFRPPRDGLRFMAPMHGIKVVDAFHEPLEPPPGFGMRQSCSPVALWLSRRSKAPEDRRTQSRYGAVHRFMVPNAFQRGWKQNRPRHGISRIR